MYLDKSAHLDLTKILKSSPSYKSIYFPKSIQEKCEEKHLDPAAAKVKKDWEKVNKKYKDELQKIETEEHQLRVEKGDILRSGRGLTIEEMDSFQVRRAELDARRTKVIGEHARALPENFQKVVEKNKEAVAKAEEKTQKCIEIVTGQAEKARASKSGSTKGETLSGSFRIHMSDVPIKKPKR